MTSGPCLDGSDPCAMAAVTTNAPTNRAGRMRAIFMVPRYRSICCNNDAVTPLEVCSYMVNGRIGPANGCFQVANIASRCGLDRAPGMTRHTWSRSLLSSRVVVTDDRIGPPFWSTPILTQNSHYG